MSGISLPGFEILDSLRQTSKTITVKAVQRSLDRTVALTFLRPELAGNENESRRFLNIARVCAQAKADGLPQIYDINTHGEQPYIVMEYVEGMNVAEIVRQKGPLPIVLSMRIALTVSDALNHAWQQSRLVHRNLKPSEIRVDERGTPKLTDFGRATIILPDGRMADEEEPGVIVGTPNFLSPEQVQGKDRIDCRADIYAMGATLYYMITGRVPFPDSDPEVVIQKQLTDQIPHPRTYRPEVNASISGLISRLMMKVPEDRYSDWNEVLGDMQLALKNQPLRRRETAQKGISTVSSVALSTELPPAPELPNLRKVDLRATVIIPTMPAVMRAQPPAADSRPAAMAAEPVVDVPSTPTPKNTRRSPNLFLRFAFSLLLTGWFVVLGNDRLNNPLHLPLPSPLLPLDAWLSAISVPPLAPVGTPQPAIVADNRAHPAALTPMTTPSVAAPVPATPSSSAAPSPTDQPANPAKDTKASPSQTAAPAPEPKNAPAAAQALTDDLKKQLASALAQGDLAAARALLAGKADRLSELCSAFESIPDPLQLASQTVLASVGQEMTITYLGKDRTITPKSVANGGIEAEFTTADGKRPVTLKLAKFSPEELLKLLPQNPETPAQHAAICVQLLKAKHPADVAAHVPNCGVLGPLFEAAAAQP